MEHQNLLGGPPATLLPEDPAAAELTAGADPAAVAAAHPACLAAWASLADLALARGDAVASYAYARTGYHRGLDQLRRAGWRGQARSPGSTSRTGVSCGRCTRWARRPPRSASRTRRNAAGSSCSESSATAAAGLGTSDRPTALPDGPPRPLRDREL